MTTNENNGGLATVQSYALPDEASLRHGLMAVRRFQAIVHSELKRDHDYGIIPGTGNKPTLLKPGAEKIVKLLGLADTYEIAERVEDWDRPLFRYLIRCRLISIAHGEVISEGLGECNSMESKYRWREQSRRCPKCQAESIIKGKAEYGGGYLCFAKRGGCGAKFGENDPAILGQPIGRVENDDIYSQLNTILKMAKKRALVDAALSAGRLSDLFTQDLEDLRANAAASVITTDAPPVPDPNAPPVQDGEVLEDPTPEQAPTPPSQPTTAAATRPPKVKLPANATDLKNLVDRQKWQAGDISKALGGSMRETWDREKAKGLADSSVAASVWRKLSGALPVTSA